MANEKMTCRECGLCNVDESICSLTKRPVTLDSLRNCKKGIRKTVMERTDREVIKNA